MGEDLNMSTTVNPSKEELLAIYRQQFNEHKKLHNSYHRKKPEIKNTLLFGAGASLVGAGVANTLLAIASYKQPGVAKGYWGIANALSIATSSIFGCIMGAGVGMLQKKINPEKHCQMNLLFEEEKKILEQLNNEIEKLGGERLSYES